MGIASFDFLTLFASPRLQAIELYARLIHNFISRGQLDRELKDVHVDDHADFKADLPHV